MSCKIFSRLCLIFIQLDFCLYFGTSVGWKYHFKLFLSKNPNFLAVLYAQLWALWIRYSVNFFSIFCVLFYICLLCFQHGFCSSFTVVYALKFIVFFEPFKKLVLILFLVEFGFGIYCSSVMISFSSLSIILFFHALFSLFFKVALSVFLLEISSFSWNHFRLDNDIFFIHFFVEHYQKIRDIYFTIMI